MPFGRYLERGEIVLTFKRIALIPKRPRDLDKREEH